MPASAAVAPFADAVYRLSAHTPAQLPADTGFEVVFAGRSNAGKSSALNALCGRKALARVSKTPGRTQQLVYFDLPSYPDRRLVDLPGYGYAKVPQALQAHWQAFLQGYFERRRALCGLVVVMDIRHPLKEYDQQMLGYALARGLPAYALLTKADKLGRGAVGDAVRAVRRRLQARWGGLVEAQAFSAVSRQGVEALRAVLAQWLQIDIGGAAAAEYR